MVNENKEENKEIVELKSQDEYKDWIINQDWYQTIDLKMVSLHLEKLRQILE